MKRLKTTPKADGFFMPGEFEPHDGTIMIFPERPGSWQYGGEKALPAFLQIFQAIAAEEMLYLIVSERMKAKAEALLSGVRHIQFLEIPQDDAWARDTAPTFVRNAAGEVRGIDWQFNAWGGSVDGLYADWQADNALAGKFCEMTGIPETVRRLFPVVPSHMSFPCAAASDRRSHHHKLYHHKAYHYH